MNNKKTIILSVIASIALFALIIGATYAYFQASGGKGTNTDVNVTTYTTDVFNFEIGNDISIYADATSFASGKGNASGSTFAKAILTANNKTNTSTMNYYLYLNISNNNFGYTINENNPELLLTITDANGNAVTNITSLTYKTVTDGKGTSISGYDITNELGLITLFDNKEITASPIKTDEWNVTVTLINYNADQSKNMGKEFNARLVIQKKSYSDTLADYVIAQYDGVQGDNYVYHHDGTLENGINDGSYRYAGGDNDVNNFVCLGSEESTCPEENLYRIIGVFKNYVKMIKYLPIPDLTWDTLDSGELASSSLSTYLNGEYLTSLGELANKIATTSWKVATFSSEDKEDFVASVAADAYQSEIVQPESFTTYEAKIGLMYASDYGFAAIPEAWQTKLVDYSSTDGANWLNSTHHFEEWFGREMVSEWTTTPGITISGGTVLPESYTEGYLARPTFYFSSSVLYDSGIGTESDPIRIK